MTDLFQPDMFDIPPPYPHGPGHAKNSLPSLKAAQSVHQPSKREALILEALRIRPQTDHEIAATLGLAIACTQPRRSDMTARGVVVDSGETRLTPYGKQGAVWRIFGV